MVSLGLVALGGLLASAGDPSSTVVAQGCPQLFVPAFFSPGPQWAEMAASRPVPSTVILDITSTGAGTAPVPAFRTEVATLQARGATVLGYSSTNYATRPPAQVVSDVRHYAEWYGVKDVFLDEVTSDASHLGYYQRLDAEIRRIDIGATIWLNPGVYPAQAYLGLGDVVMAFEGPFQSFRALKVPSWARHYPASRFAFVVYATGEGNLQGSFWLAHKRRGGNLYVTDGTGANPYDGLPSYWQSEDAAVAACGTSGGGTAR